MITAHSGSDGLNDNSLSFVWHFSQNRIVDAFEIDVRRDNDGQLYLHHDKQKMKQDCLALTDVFALLQESKQQIFCNCDLKEDIVTDVLELATQFSVLEMLFLSGTINLSAVPKELQSQIVMHNIERFFPEIYRQQRYLNTAEITMYLNFCEKNNITMTNINYLAVSDEMIALFKKAKQRLSLWTVNDSELIQKYLNQGVYNVTTKIAEQFAKEKQT